MVKIGSLFKFWLVFNLVIGLYEIFIFKNRRALQLQDGTVWKKWLVERNTSNLGVDKIEGEFEETYDLEGPIDILEATEDDAPVIKFVNSLIFRAVKEKASDIHIEPFEKNIRLRYRVDGALIDVTPPPKLMQLALVSRLKIMSSLDIAERLPVDD